MSADIQAVSVSPAEPVQQKFEQLRARLEGAVVGQGALVEQLLVALLSDGHVLLEGPPGLAKTRIISVLSQLLEGKIGRASCRERV